MGMVDNVIAFCSRMSAKLKPFDKVDGFVWEAGEKPSEALWQNTIRLHHKRDWYRGEQLRYLNTHEKLMSVLKGSWAEEEGGKWWLLRNSVGPFEDFKQEITPSTDYDRKLAGQSRLDTHPLEVVQVRLFLKNGGAPKESNVIEGDSHTVTLSRFDPEIEKEVRKLNALGIPVAEIEVSHTHPVAPLLVKHGSSAHVEPAELSLQDVRMAKEVSVDVPNTLVSVRAITPTGTTYVIRFMNGKQVY